MTEESNAARNGLLRAARREAGLTAAGLAEQVNTWIMHRYGRVTCMTEGYLRKYESGRVRWPREDYRAALRAVLGLPRDADLGFRPPAATELGAGEDVDRRNFFLAAAGLGTGVLAVPPAVLLADAARTPVPTSVGAAEIAQIRTLAQAFSMADHTLGAGGLVRQAVIAQLRHSMEMLKADVPAELQRDLYSAVSYMAGVAAFGAVDLGAYAEADRLHRYAQALADETGDWSKRTATLADRIRAAIWSDRPDDAWTLAETALVRADRISHAEQAMLHGLKAHALSLMDGHKQDVLREVASSDECYSRADPTEAVPPWFRYYTPAEHDSVAAVALAGIAGGQRSALAAADERYTRSVASFGDTYRRSATMAALGHTRMHLLHGDLDRAAQLGRHAIGTATTVRSRRTGVILTDIIQLTSTHPGAPAMRDLHDRARRILAATPT